MKKILFVISAAAAVSITACTKTDFANAYSDPSKVNSTTVSKQFAGFLTANLDYVVPSYWNYFVVLRITLDPYNQATGFANASNQYIPGASATSNRWDNYYNFLAQYRELQKVNASLTQTEQDANRIFMIAATIYLYDHTQKMVDLYGDLPFTEAGMLSTKGGDYANTYAKYDKAEDLYTKMLDDLKGFATELNTIAPAAGTLATFKNQDLINKGDLTLWKKYCNSLRLRLLTRVSAVSAFQARVTSEMADITGNPSTYPVVTANSDNIQMSVYDLSSGINAKGFRSGLEDWNGNLAGKVMIDHMNTNADPRLRVMFRAGDSSNGAYIGLDPSLDASTQSDLINNSGKLAIYNRTTFSRNQYFPGELINAAEVSFLLSEYYLNANNDAAAKTAYETGIKQSIAYYYNLRSISNDNTDSIAGASTASTAEISTYLASPAVSWDAASTTAAKLTLIATQKWLHFSIVQPVENWAETRRLDAPALTFWSDNSSIQKQPPYRWLYPTSENTYNTKNYQAVQANDKLTTKIFWDVK